MCLTHENLSSMKAWILVLFVHYVTVHLTEQYLKHTVKILNIS